MNVRNLLWVAVMVAGVSEAQQPAPGDEGARPDRFPAAPPAVSAESSRQVVEQKRALVDRMLSNSPVAQRINASQNAEAKRYLASARELHGHAQSLLAAGQLGGADALLNEAMWQIGKARQLVPDPMSRVIEERIRYAQLQESVQSVQNSYQLNVARDKAKGRRDVTEEKNFAKASQLVEDAKSLATSEQLVDANRLLDQALALMLQDFHKHLGGQTLVYSNRFTDPQEEFNFELERNRSYESLVPLAVTEYRPAREAINLIDKYVAQSRGLREKAQQEAANRNFKGGTRNLQEATDHLQRALQAAGLSVPQTIGSQ